MTVELPTKAINTTKVPGRRELHFNSLEDIWQEAQRLSRGDVRLLGNWSFGQILMHLAEAMHQAIDGAPFRAPWYIRTVAPLFKRWVLTRPMPPGYQLPKDAAKHLVSGETSTEEGLKALRLAIDRLQREDKRAPSPFLGPMTREDYNLLHQRHAEMHLSFVVPA